MSPKQLVLDFEWDNIVTQIERLPLRDRERNCLIAIARLAADWQTYDGSLAEIGREMRGSKSAAKRATDLCIAYGALQIEEISKRRRRFTIDWLTVIDAPELPMGLYKPAATKPAAAAVEMTVAAPSVDESADGLAQCEENGRDRSTWFFEAWRFVCWVALSFHQLFRERATWRADRSTWAPERATNRADRSTWDVERATSQVERSTSAGGSAEPCEAGGVAAPKSAESRAERATYERSTPLNVPPGNVPPSAQHVVVKCKTIHKQQHPPQRARAPDGSQTGGWPFPLQRKHLTDPPTLRELYNHAVAMRWIEEGHESQVWFLAAAKYCSSRKGNACGQFTKAVAEHWRGFADADWDWAKQLLGSSQQRADPEPEQDMEALRRKQQASLAAAQVAGKFKLNLK